MSDRKRPTEFTLKSGQQVAIGITWIDGTRIPTQPAIVKRIDEKSIELELPNGGGVTILV